MNPLAAIGRGFLTLLATTGRIGLFASAAIGHCVRPPFYPRLILRQFIEIGYYSLPVVGMTTLFSGMVLALQSYTGFARFSAEGAVATVVVLSMTRELAPVLAGLMVAGVYKLDFNAANYISSTIQYLERMDVISGLVKAAVFGFLIALMGCYHGYNSRGGAQGVGAATTNAVVTASIMILVANYVITEMFFAD